MANRERAKQITPTPISHFETASSYLRALQMLESRGISQCETEIAFFMMAGFATEIFLKCILAADGKSVREHGHDLWSAMLAASSADLFDRVDVSEVSAVVVALRDFHFNHSFRYMEDDPELSVPHPELVIRVLLTLKAIAVRALGLIEEGNRLSFDMDKYEG